MVQQLVSAGSVDGGRPDHLGRVLFQRQEKFSTGVFSFALAIALLALSVFMAWEFAHQRTLAGGLKLVIGVALNAGALGLIGNGFREIGRAGTISSFHERGARIVDKHGAVRHELRYDDVEELTFGNTRLFMNGAYHSTNQYLQVGSGARSDPPIRVAEAFREDTGLATNYRAIHGLEPLCYRIADLMGQRLRGRLERKHAVPWLDQLRIRTDGLVLGSQATEEFVPWAKIVRLDVNEGVFKLWLQGEEKPRVELPTSTPNFYPGYFLAAEYVKKNANGPLLKADEALEPAEATPSLTVAYANTVDDFLVLRRYEYRTDRTKWLAWQVKAWDLSMLIVIPGLVTSVATWYTHWITQEAAILGAAGSVLAALLLRPCRGKVLWFLERRKVAAELQAAHLWAEHRRCPDPFLDRRISFDRTGYLVRTPAGAVCANWRDLSRIEFFEDYLFLYLGADQIHPEQIALLIPARAFANAEAARKAFEALKALHTKASAGK
jgi:hypothetical protein